MQEADDCIYIRLIIWYNLKNSFIGVPMIFPLEQLIKFKDNIYEITCAASRRAYQLSMIDDETVRENDGKVVSTAARQLFTDEVQYRIEK